MEAKCPTKKIIKFAGSVAHTYLEERNFVGDVQIISKIKNKIMRSMILENKSSEKKPETDSELKEKKSLRIKPQNQYFTERTYLRLGRSHTGTIYLCVQSTEDTLSGCVAEIKAILPKIDEQLYLDFDKKFNSKSNKGGILKKKSFATNE